MQAKITENSFLHHTTKENLQIVVRILRRIQPLLKLPPANDLQDEIVKCEQCIDRLEQFVEAWGPTVVLGGAVALREAAINIQAGVHHEIACAVYKATEIALLICGEAGRSESSRVQHRAADLAMRAHHHADWAVDAYRAYFNYMIKKDVEEIAMS